MVTVQALTLTFFCAKNWTISFNQCYYYIAYIEIDIDCRVLSKELLNIGVACVIFCVIETAIEGFYIAIAFYP